MADAGSLPKKGDMIFDLDTQSGVTEVLLAIRASDLSVPQKNELRDLVFLYVNGGKEKSIRLALENKIASIGLLPAHTRKAQAVRAKQLEQPVIGSFRSAPAFSVPAVAYTPPVKPEAPKIKEPEPAPAPVTVSVSKTPVDSSADTLPVVPNAPLPHMQEPVSMVDEPVPVTVQTPALDQQRHLDRIREIKAHVNQKVGNPVNLVDINNDVGREYMSALLEAMKRINSGGIADLAMARLEAAFEKVLQVVDEHESKNLSAASNVPQAAHRPVTPPHEVTPDAPVEPLELTIKEIPQTQPPLSSVSIPVVPVTAPAPIPVAPVPTPQVSTADPAPTVREVPIARVYTPPPPPSYKPEDTPQAAAPLQQSPDPYHTAPAAKFASLADMGNPTVSTGGLPTTPVSQPKMAAGDPLLAPDVEEGLTQLLSEWVIFQKSGMFGTGPKGREHPLYKKMADVQIPLLLAGRFEGATQEVRQSLTSYINAWRYEQGIIYERGETFERYLRRVIRHILDLQKR